MDTIFTLPLFLLSCLQGLLSLLLLCPKAVSLPTAGLLRTLARNTAANAVLSTFAVAFAVLSLVSLVELLKGLEKAARGDIRAGLSKHKCQLDFTEKNLDALKRQVKGLQSEYERVTAKTQADAQDGALIEATALKKQVDKLIQDKAALQASVEVAEKAAKASQVNLEGLKNQMTGLAREYDRLAEENGMLSRKLSQSMPAVQPTVANKKVD